MNNITSQLRATLAKSALLLCLTLMGNLESKSQTVSATITGGACAGTFSFTFSGTLNGRNQYSGSATISGFPVTATLIWSGTQWEIAALGQVIFSNTANTTTPPCHNTGTWVLSASATTCTGGVITNSTGCVTIPVELVSFVAKNMGKTNQLTWQTATELNSKGFSIQRSADGATWQSIDFVASKGNKSDYTFVDDTPLSISYYRLQQEDWDGRTEFSKTVSAYLKGSKTAFVVSPNPLKSDVLHIAGLNDEASNISITDIYGKSLYQQTVTTDQADMRFTLPSGVYFVVVKTNNAVLTQKIIKE